MNAELVRVVGFFGNFDVDASAGKKPYFNSQNLFEIDICDFYENVVFPINLLRTKDNLQLCNKR
eukprot:Pgem_evm1s17808